jgi:putative flippase GtrA
LDAAHPRWLLAREVPTFLVVGALGFITQALTLQALVEWMGMAANPAWFPAFGTAVVLTYLLNRMWTFRHRAGPAWRDELARYALLQSVGALVNYSIYAALLWLSSVAREEPVLALAAGSITAMTVNFVGIRQLAFVSPALSGRAPQHAGPLIPVLDLPLDADATSAATPTASR